MRWYSYFRSRVCLGMATSRSRAKSKASDRSVRPTRAYPTPALQLLSGLSVTDEQLRRIIRPAGRPRASLVGGTARLTRTRARATSTPRSKASDRSVRPTRATPRSTARPTPRSKALDRSVRPTRALHAPSVCYEIRTKFGGVERTPTFRLTCIPAGRNVAA